MENWGLFPSRRIILLGWLSKTIYDFRSHIKQNPINDLLVKEFSLRHKAYLEKKKKKRRKKEERRARKKERKEKGRKGERRRKEKKEKERKEGSRKEGGKWGRGEGRKAGNDLLWFVFFIDLRREIYNRC